jgi:hypothetical protein
MSATSQREKELFACAACASWWPGLAAPVHFSPSCFPRFLDGVLAAGVLKDMDFRNSNK